LKNRKLHHTNRVGISSCGSLPGERFWRREFAGKENPMGCRGVVGDRATREGGRDGEQTVGSKKKKKKKNTGRGIKKL